MYNSNENTNTNILILLLIFQKKEDFENPNWSDMTDYQCGFQPPLKKITTNRVGKLTFFELKNKMVFLKYGINILKMLIRTLFCICSFSDGKRQVP